MNKPVKWLVVWYWDDGERGGSGCDECDTHEEAEQEIDRFKKGCESSSTRLSYGYTLYKAEEVRTG